MSRSGDIFVDNDNNHRTEPITLPLAHARGVKSIQSAVGKKGKVDSHTLDE